MRLCFFYNRFIGDMCMLYLYFVSRYLVCSGVVVGVMVEELLGNVYG